ncbi:O-antigen ligase family protein [Thermoleophilia bacterium SCSIO 60948]|nr:O-antigen ligase family protein [Thermoleophilia bacterium SCSIO 60948]
MQAPPQSSSRSPGSAAATKRGEPSDNGALEALTTLTIGAALAAPIVVRGGFTPVSQWVFVALSLAALALAAFGSRDALRVAAGGWAPTVLAALGLLTLASAGWTEVDPGAAVRAGAVVLATAALALATAAVAGRRGPLLLGFVVAIAVAEAAFGSVASLLRDEPFAERLGGGWRPGGTFEYSPALALLCVTALPIAVAWGARPRAGEGSRVRVALASAATAVLAVSLGLSDARLGVALGLTALVGVFVLARPLGVERRAAGAIGSAAIGAGAVAALVLGGPTGFGVAATEGDAARIATLAAIVLVASLVATVVAGIAPTSGPADRVAPESRPGRGRPVATVLAAAVALVVVGLAAGISSEGAAEPVGVEGDGGITHGRTEQWSAALAAGAERPLGGWGAGSYSLAAAEQGASYALYAHSLPLESFAELGLLGTALVIALYAACGVAVWRARRSPVGLLAGWGVLCFGFANLVDWPWHLAGCVAVFAVLLGVVLVAGLGDGLRARPALVEP